MLWARTVEYITWFVEDGKQYCAKAIKYGDDETYEIVINKEYITDCDGLPTREYLRKLIIEEEALAIEASASTFRVA